MRVPKTLQGWAAIGRMLSALVGGVVGVVSLTGDDGGSPKVSESAATGGATRAAADESPEFCGEFPSPTGGGIFALQATNVDCDFAKVVAQEWDRSCKRAGVEECTVASGLDCTGKRIASEVFEWTCVEGTRRVEFSWGV